MRITVNLKLNLKVPEVTKAVEKANRLAMRDTVVDIAADAIKGSPALTGNNRRSIKFETGPGGEVAKKDLEGAVYSTSGYGGFLETGTVRMPPRPYMKPAMDRHFTEQKFGSKVRRYLK
ncbi:hypothetical protein LCGC14_2359840 [marine sediment metagenome]|uniref:HK97 gp10 family phage protein n=1 Tax=marine sediment metagenome TaxID=412755 RepID=A0A0F9C6S4_9ZZZZ